MGGKEWSGSLGPERKNYRKKNSCFREHVGEPAAFVAPREVKKESCPKPGARPKGLHQFKGLSASSQGGVGVEETAGILEVGGRPISGVAIRGNGFQ